MSERVYRTSCPECGSKESLEVTEGRWWGSAKLTTSGYELAMARVMGTSREQVECSACRAQFALEDLETVIHRL